MEGRGGHLSHYYGGSGLGSCEAMVGISVYYQVTVTFKGPHCWISL